MKPFTIASFKYGLDTRREALTSQPGTLLGAQDVHITQGGEVEKRKAFVRLGSFDTAPFDFVGMEATDIGLVTFIQGVEAPISGPFAIGPINYYIQNLTPPGLAEGGTYSGGLSTVVSTTFDGKALAIATFLDGTKFLYFDGKIVAQSRNGLVFAGLDTLAKLSTQLKTQIDRLTSWNSLDNVDESGNAQDGTTIVKSPAGVYYTPVSSFVSTAGQLGAGFVDKDNAGTAETKATAAFKITRSADGTVEITAPKNSDGTGTAALTAGPVDTAATATAMAIKVAQTVNDLSYVHGYTALNNNDTIVIYAPIGWGALANTLVITVNVTGGMGTAAAGTLPTALAATVSPSPVSVVVTGKNDFFGNPPGPRTVSGRPTISPSGGTTPYTYAWTELTTGSGGGITIQSAATANPLFSKIMTANTTADGSFKCVVTDGAAATITVVLSVHFEYKTVS